MTILAELKIWSFDGVHFARQIQGGDWQPWFEVEAIHQVDTVLMTGERYVDWGGTNYPPLQLRAVTESKADRDSLVEKAENGTTGTLSNGKGLSRGALPVRATPIDMGGAGWYAADITFVPLSD